jgi:hypothetical protein
MIIRVAPPRRRPHSGQPVSRSARVPYLPELLTEYPIAVQAVAEVHDTAVTSMTVAAVGLGVCWIAQPEAALAGPTMPQAKIRARR